MTIKEITTKLFEGITPSFEKHGFKLNKRKRKFARSINGITNIFDFFFYSKNGYVTIEPEIRIKVSSIEKVYSSVSLIKDRPYLTMGNHLFEVVRYLEGGKENGVREEALSNWIIQDEKQIQKLIKVIPEYLEDYILKYFDEFDSISSIDIALNKHPRDLSIHNYIYPLRANVGIIAAKLNGNLNFQKILEIYQEELEEAEETYKDDFQRIKQELLK